MNPQVIEYYESLFKIEIMQKQFASASQTLKELALHYVGQDTVHECDIYAAYANVIRELIG
ncbi:hypothetical protein FOH38_20130 [Lysinibacillus fusiformis]|nr:hypothetical protein FOH38_20130 [Lysinibacillus fusiformis]